MPPVGIRHYSASPLGFRRLDIHCSFSQHSYSTSDTLLLSECFLSLNLSGDHSEDIIEVRETFEVRLNLLSLLFRLLYSLYIVMTTLLIVSQTINSHLKVVNEESRSFEDRKKYRSIFYEIENSRIYVRLNIIVV